MADQTALKPQDTTNPPAPEPKSILTDEDKRQLNLAVRNQETSVMNPIEYEQLRIMARDLHTSGAFPESYKSSEQILMAMIMGRSMGMTPHESVVNGYFIRGTYNVYGKAVPAALRRHSWQFKFIDESPESCTVVLTNTKTGEVIEDTFTFKDAEQSGFTGGSTLKVGWKAGANRKRKLRYGVLSQVVHTYIPDVLGAVGGVAEYTEDYVQSEYQNKDEVDRQRQERMNRAAQHRATMVNGQPQVLDPIEADSIDMKADAEEALSQEDGA